MRTSAATVARRLLRARPRPARNAGGSPSLDREAVDGEPDQQLAERANPLLVGAKTRSARTSGGEQPQGLPVATTRLPADREPLWPAELLLRAFAALAREFSRCRTSTSPPDAGRDRGDDRALVDVDRDVSASSSSGACGRAGCGATGWSASRSRAAHSARLVSDTAPRRHARPGRHHHGPVPAREGLRRSADDLLKVRAARGLANGGSLNDEGAAMPPPRSLRPP
jgi:hypothetical protein